LKSKVKGLKNQLFTFFIFFVDSVFTLFSHFRICFIFDSDFIFQLPFNHSSDSYSLK
jgi:hypothetical protein